MAKPYLLDLYCGAGGAARGYADAGFEVVGVDINPQPRYPYEFHQYDALTLLRAQRNGWEGWPHHFDAVHASPPCHDHSTLSSITGADGSGALLATTRELLARLGRPYVIENVMGAPMREALVLCGSELGLSTHYNGRRIWLRRHRQFESNILLMGAGGCNCYGRHIIGVYGHGDGGGRGRRKGWKGTFALRKDVMGIDWMNRDELAQAIPPAYTRFIGEQLIERIGFAAGAGRVPEAGGQHG